jgi:hypothetical protein
MVYAAKLVPISRNQYIFLGFGICLVYTAESVSALFHQSFYSDDLSSSVRIHELYSVLIVFPVLS